MCFFNERKSFLIPRAPRFRNHGNGTWCYSFYRRGRNLAPRTFLPDRVLPQPNDQKKHGTCLAQAMGNCLESLIRIKRGRKRQTWRTPRLSIQHLIDQVGRNYYRDDHLKVLINNGVTTARNCPYVGKRRANTTYVAGKRYFIKSSKTYAYEDYKWHDLGFMRMLFRWLKKVGPFIASYSTTYSSPGIPFGDSHQRTSVTPSVVKEVEDRVRKVRLKESYHAIQIVGYKVKYEGGVKRKRSGEEVRSFGGYWIFLQSCGRHWGNKNGLGIVDFDALNSVTLMKARITCKR